MKKPKMTSVRMLICAFIYCTVLSILFMYIKMVYVVILPELKYRYTLQTNKYKTILYWNKYFGKYDMNLGLGNKIFENCTFKNCRTTSNKLLVKIDDFDAIVFHTVGYHGGPDDMPPKRKKHQKYIFYSMESPYGCTMNNNINFYNWTMTYRSDSDIHFPYGLVQKRNTTYILPSSKQVDNRKHKVAWFVSKCHTKEGKRRSLYARTLSRYISVHIYGRCGTYICKRTPDIKDISKDPCYKLLEKRYKFYLSFENAMCGDYVTEKLFNVLQFDVIPIVMGGSNYSKIAPPMSVINVKDFVSPKDLAEYLYELDSNYDKYVKYFEWKKKYVVTTSCGEYVLCQLCEILNKPLNYSYYKDIKEWFLNFNCFV